MSTPLLPGVPPPRPRLAPAVKTQHVGPGEIPYVDPPKVQLPVVVQRKRK